jgi:hypothetical protein
VGVKRAERPSFSVSSPGAGLLSAVLVQPALLQVDPALGNWEIHIFRSRFTSPSPWILPYIHPEVAAPHPKFPDTPSSME